MLLLAILFLIGCGSDVGTTEMAATTKYSQTVPKMAEADYAEMLNKSVSTLVSGDLVSLKMVHSGMDKIHDSYVIAVLDEGNKSPRIKVLYLGEEAYLELKKSTLIALFFPDAQNENRVAKVRLRVDNERDGQLLFVRDTNVYNLIGTPCLFTAGALVENKIDTLIKLNGVTDRFGAASTFAPMDLWKDLNLYIVQENTGCSVFNLGTEKTVLKWRY